MNWIDREIHAWQFWATQKYEGQMVPWERQIGKLLENAERNVDRAIAIATYNLNQDDKMAGPTKDKYWVHIIRVLKEQQVNDLMME